MRIAMDRLGADDPLRRGPDVCERITLKYLDITVTPLTASETSRVVAAAEGKRILLNHNLHSAYLHETDDRFRQLYRIADWIVIDGAPIRWLTSWSSGKKFGPHFRIGSTDWLVALSEIGTTRRLFVFGATVESNKLAVQALRDTLPSWTVAGIDGYVDHACAVATIKDFRPDIVLVGLGMPTQEHFLLTNLPQLPEATYATVGGAIDYVAGTTRLSPRWLGRLGLEWAWRLVNQPRRLAHRYLIEPLKLFGHLVVRHASR